MVDPKNRNNPLEIAVALFDDILPSNVIEKNFVKMYLKIISMLLIIIIVAIHIKHVRMTMILRKTMMEIVKPITSIDTTSKKVMLY